MSDETDDEDRTEAPSPKKLERARAQGDVPQSADLAAAVQVLGAAAGLTLLGGDVWARLQRGLGAGLVEQLRLAPGRVGTPAGAAALGQGALELLARAALPLVLVIAAAAAIGTLAQRQPVFSLEKLGFQLSRLDPIQGFSRLFSGQALTNLGMALLKLLVVGAAIAAVVPDLLRSFASTLGGDLRGSAARGGLLALDLVWAGAGGMLGVGLLDLFLARRRWTRRMSMSKQELRQEMREEEGDPHLKGRLRQRMREARRQRGMLEAVKTADVVVMNPTHYAVALRYDRARMAAPKVVAKGTDALALKIRDIAREAGVGVIEEPPLARALHKAVPVGAEVPQALYQAVARVLAWAWRTKGGKR